VTDGGAGKDDDDSGDVQDGEAEAGEGEGEGDAEGDAEAQEKKGDHWYYDTNPLLAFGMASGMYDLISQSKPMLSQGAYLLVAMWNVIYAGSYAFRYRSKASYYDIGKLGDNSSNRYKLSDQIRLYGTLAIFVPISITQLLSMFGIATGINMLAWGLLGGLGSAILFIAKSLTRNIAYGNAWDKAHKTTSTSAVKLASGATVAAIEEDEFDDIAMEAAMGVLLAYHFDNWYWTNFEGLTIEQQDK
jgi:hypothetical protein